MCEMTGGAAGACGMGDSGAERSDKGAAKPGCSACAVAGGGVSVGVHRSGSDSLGGVDGSAGRVRTAVNVCKGVPTAALEAAGPGAMAALLSLVRQAAAPGGIGEHEFSRPGGWRDRALKLLGSVDRASGGVFHLFELEVDFEGVLRSFVVSARGSDVDDALRAATARVACAMGVAYGSPSIRVLAAEFQGHTQCDHVGEITGSECAPVPGGGACQGGSRDANDSAEEEAEQAA